MSIFVTEYGSPSSLSPQGRRTAYKCNYSGVLTTCGGSPSFCWQWQGLRRKPCHCQQNLRSACGAEESGKGDLKSYPTNDYTNKRSLESSISCTTCLTCAEERPYNSFRMADAPCSTSLSGTPISRTSIFLSP